MTQVQYVLLRIQQALGITSPVSLIFVYLVLLSYAKIWKHWRYRLVAMENYNHSAWVRI